MLTSLSIFINCPPSKIYFYHDRLLPHCCQQLPVIIEKQLNNLPVRRTHNAEKSFGNY